MDQNIEDVAHEFWLYLQNFLAKGMAPPLETSDSQGRPGRTTAAYLRNGFLLNLRDQARHKDISQYRYLYRRLRQAIAEGPEFYSRSIGGGSFFSLELGAKPQAALETRVGESYAQWPSPAGLVGPKDLERLRAKDLNLLAEFFWRQAVERLGRPAFLPIRSLVDFLVAHYEHLRDPQQRQLSDQALAHEGLAAHNVSDQDGLEILAWQVASLWSSKRRKVFQLTLDPGNLTLEQIAQMTGLSGPSHVKYQLDRACDDLALVFESWPGVAPAARERSFWTKFLLYIAETCKKDFGDR